jgi:hypothetical protein
MSSVGLLLNGFSTAHISKVLKNADVDRQHWLIVYEAVRQGFLKDSEHSVTNNRLFSDLMAHRVTFYRTKLPTYASVVHPGGAPDWVVRKWMGVSIRPDIADARMPVDAPIPELIKDDLARLMSSPSTDDEAVAGLLDLLGDDVETDLDDMIYPL